MPCIYSAQNKSLINCLDSTTETTANITFGFVISLTGRTD